MQNTIIKIGTLIFLLFIVQGCNNSSLPSNITPISVDGNDITLDGYYSASNDANSLGEKVLGDIWNIARTYKQAKSLSLSIKIKGKNRYGENKDEELGRLQIDNLENVRMFKSSSYYVKDIEAMTEWSVFMLRVQNGW